MLGIILGYCAALTGCRRRAAQSASALHTYGPSWKKTQARRGPPGRFEPMTPLRLALDTARGRIALVCLERYTPASETSQTGGRHWSQPHDARRHRFNTRTIRHGVLNTATPGGFL